MRSLVLLVASLALAQCAVLEADHCSWGESYWCSKLKVAHECGAVQHCMTTVWKNKQPQTSVDDSDVCQFCETVMADVKKFIQDQQDQKIIQKYLESACAIIPDKHLADECKTLVDEYLDIVLELIASELDPKTVCSLMGLCSGDAFKDTARHPNLRLPEKPKNQVEEEPLCTDCKKFFGDIKKYITSSTTETELEDLIKQNLCVMMGSLQEYCNQMVEAYIPEILDLLVNEFYPDEMCAAVGFCDNTGPSFLTLKSLLFNAAQKTSGDETCTLCRTAITELQAVVKNTKVIAGVQSVLKKYLCKRLGDLTTACNATVDQYLPELFEMLAMELNAGTVCKFMGFCSDTATPVTSLRLPLPAEKVPVQMTVEVDVSSAQCIMCQFVVKELNSMLSKNSTQQEIVETLTHVCSILPGSMKTTCKDFVHVYAPEILAMLAKEMDPSFICSFIGLCSGSSSSGSPQKAASSFSPGCVLCELVMKELDSLLTANATEQEIEAALDEVCSLLPSIFQVECEDFVKKYAPEIIALLQKELDPSEICASLGLCSIRSSSSSSQKSGDTSDPKAMVTDAAVGGPLCAPCEKLIKTMDTLLEQNATVQKIVQLVEKVCQLVPADMRGECRDLVELYSPAIIQLIAQFADPTKVCTLLHLCQAQTGNADHPVGLPQVQASKLLFLLGGKDCSLGPTYWCDNMDNAVKCNAVEHCKRHIWQN